MKKLDINQAKKIALEISQKINPPDHRDFILIHSEKVGKIAKLIAQKMNLDSDVFEIAGWVHDIGYSVNFENHADFAIPILNKLDYEVNNILEDCILNHGNKKNPKTTEGKIFQLADKFSIFDFDVVKTILKHDSFPPKKETIAFLKKMIEKSIYLLENF